MLIIISTEKPELFFSEDFRYVLFTKKKKKIFNILYSYFGNIL